MSQWLSLSLFLSLAVVFSCLAPANAQNDIVGHVIAGYQGWFSQSGDGSPVGSLPAGTGNYHSNLECYPDLREFPDKEQWSDTKNGSKLPNGNPAKTFSSDRDFTITKHVSWMKQYGVEVAALQRFGEVINNPVYAAHKNDVTLRLKNACESGGVKFYIEYDASGSGGKGWGDDWVQSIKDDWSTFAVKKGITASSAYARQGGKTVVELWGIGLKDNDIATDPAQWLDLIQWFKKNDCYVIGGVATGWLGTSSYKDAVPGFEKVYAACDAISPWVVGRFSTPDGADNYASENLTPELAWCKAKGIAYIPCVYPGTSFYNSNHKVKNIIPRLGGQLMWRQFANLRKLGIDSCFISMFDEYNEATQIIKTAEDATQIPTDVWYLTLDADKIPLSSDFYLRLTRDAGKMLKSQEPIRWTVPTPHWNNLLATSFESDEPQPTGGHGTDPGYQIVSGGKAQSGSSSLRYSGNADAYRYSQIFDYSAAPRTITQDTILYYWLYPENENARYVSIDFQFTDGTTLQSSVCLDQNGHSLQAKAGHGGQLTLNAWSVITSNLGSLAGKKIAKIGLVFDRPGATGSYQGYLDDLRITN